MGDAADHSVVVELLGIRKQFPGVLANDDISLQIRQGEIFAILGENGAGKTTLMNILFGLYRPDEGKIRIRGREVEFSSPRDATALGIGMVHQHFKLVENYTVAQNIILGLEPLKKWLGLFPLVNEKAANKEIALLSDHYGLKVDPRLPVGEASVSVQQRVEILKMLYRKADILILDEPTAMLAPQEIEHLIEVIHELRRHGNTVILITHKLDEIKRLADRCAVLRRGRLVDVFDVASTDTAHMAATMVGQSLDFEIIKEDRPFGEVVLEVENLTVMKERNVTAVRDVSFSVREGEVVALAGVAGNGQVEIVEAVYGQMKASSGRVLLKGRDITGHSIRTRIREGISYVPEDRQRTGLVIDMTLSENLALKTYGQAPFSKRKVMNRTAFKRHANKLIEAYDIRSGSGDATIVHSMSGGTQQKAIVAREIDLGNQLIIFVQPTRGLDIAARTHIHRQIMEERAKGHAILLVSLELDEIMELADTIGVLYNGVLRKIAPAGELTLEEVGQLMLGVGA
jgi:ABC-type uncharacterized transport system ATPase subunit